MSWMERNDEVRNDPRLLLDGTRSLIVCLFSFHSKASQAPGAPYVSRYALGRDYHKVLRRRLKPLCEMLAAGGFASRICIDSAPLRERYWASRSGAAIIGLNNCLIVPGKGTSFVMATVLTTASLTPTLPLCPEAADGRIACERCGRCVRACPTGALHSDGSVDASRCLCYLTIEAPDDVPLPRLDKKYAFGCDECRLACPHTADDIPSEIADFAPRKSILDMTADDWLALDEQRYRTLFNGTPIRRASLQRLLNNLR